MNMTTSPCGEFQLLPPDPATCELCAVNHRHTEAHNAASLFYQYRFYGQWGRWPTWADAIAHCSTDVQTLWKRLLQDRCAWTEPADGSAPISEIRRMR